MNCYRINSFLNRFKKFFSNTTDQKPDYPENSVSSAQEASDGKQLASPAKRQKREHEQFYEAQRTLNTVKHVRFTDSMRNMPENAVDISEQEDGSAAAWFDRNTETLVIAGEGGVYAPADCEHLFWRYSNIVSITGLEHLHTDDVTSMRCMFRTFSPIESLDISGFYTAGDCSFNDLFENLHSLRFLKLPDFSRCKGTISIPYTVKERKMVEVGHSIPSPSTDEDRRSQQMCPRRYEEEMMAYATPVMEERLVETTKYKKVPVCKASTKELRTALCIPSSCECTFTKESQKPIDYTGKKNVFDRDCIFNPYTYYIL